MTFIVYALRLKGEQEARYVGQTGQHLDHRLATHFSTAKIQPLPEPRCVWLLDNASEIECVALAYAKTREQARVLEAQFIYAFVAMGHRLFNRQHVPPHLKIGDGEEIEAMRHVWVTTGQMPRRKAA